MSTGGTDPVPPLPGVVAGLVALACAAASAILLAHRDRAHRPVAIALGGTLGASAARMVLASLVLTMPGPYTGILRGAFHIEEILYLASTAAVAWVSAAVLSPAGPMRQRALLFVLAAWAAASLVLVLGYPAIRGEPLRLVYLACELATLLAFVSCSVSLARREGLLGLFSSPARIVVFLLGGASILGLLAGPWALGLFGPAYLPQSIALAVVYFACFAVQLIGYRTARPSE